MTSPLPGAPTGPPADTPTGTSAATPSDPAPTELVPALTIAPHTVVVDEHTARVGEVMGSEGPYLQLRPLCGGREWDADPARVRPASAEERLRASVAAVNARSRHAPRGHG
ncbi:hypothetical protein AB0945_17170 [Streptomyces sp. NPDC005474]|uniref:hypothetical protein n=1 Tax=Streptomyces sp. NPDC005474 TaxID=3154878 RepID=UPI0034542232